MAELIIDVKSAQPIPGYRFGLSQPSLVAALDMRGPWPDQPALIALIWQPIAALLPPQYQTPPKMAAMAPRAALPMLLGALAGAMQDSVGLPVVAQPQVFVTGAAPHTGEDVVLVLPCFVAKAAEIALRALVPLCAPLCAPDAAPLTQAQIGQIDAALDQIAKIAPSGSNTHRLLRNALLRKVPIVPMPGGVFQFGWGAKSRLFKSSISDATAAISTGWAKSKVQTNQILRMAGLPVPLQVTVADLATAQAEAAKIGYPVVLKPADLEQGIGVEAGLNSPDDLAAAYGRVATLGRSVLLERHVHGQDVRVNVLQGQFQDAIARDPAGVTGDGVQDITALIAAVNQDPRRSLRRFSDMRPITLNDEARALLREQGLDDTSVPAQGRFVRLRRAANISSGGTSRSVTEDLHPDNARLCEQAARLLRLDIAGVDLLIPDYRQSWRVVGGAICEVNAQPQVGLTYPQIYDRLFDHYLNGQGRVPIYLILTDDRAVADLVPARFHLASDLAGQGAGHLAQVVRAGLIDPRCAGVVMVTDGRDFARFGLPIDRLDQIYVTGGAADLAALVQRLSIAAAQAAQGPISIDPALAALPPMMPKLAFRPMSLGAALSQWAPDYGLGLP